MLVRKLARKRGVGITTAIKEAVSEALSSGASKSSLWDETADIRAMISSRERTGMRADKAFFDELSGHGNPDVQEDGNDVR